jgi:hypothetical protein
MPRRFKEASGVNSFGALALGDSWARMGVVKAARASRALTARERFIENSFT